MLYQSLLRILLPIAAITQLVGMARKQTLDRWGHHIGLDTQKVAQLESKYAGHIGKSLLLGKLTFVIGVAFLVASGMAQYPFKNFCLLIFW